MKIIQDDAVKLEKKIENRDEKILPRPVVRYFNVMNSDEIIEFKTIYLWHEWLMWFYDRLYWFDKETRLEYSAKHLAELIMLCISFLHHHGYDEKKIRELFAVVDKDNERKGFF